MNMYAQAPTISKIAAPKFDVENEKALIKQYQSTNDVALKNSILKKMSKIHRGTIIYAMQSATGYALSAEAKNVIALKTFKEAMDKYDPSKGSQPASFFTESIKREVGRENYKGTNETFMAEGHNILNQNVHTVKTQFELEGNKNPSPFDIQQRIEKLYNKKADVKDIERVGNLTRRDLSGNMQSEDNGETITFEDVYNTMKVTPQNVLNSRINDTRLDNAMKNLSPLERDVFTDRKGIMGKGKESAWMGVAVNNNLKSEYMAKKIYQQAELKIRSSLMGDGGNDF